MSERIIYIRWYDRFEHLALLMNFSATMPSEIQSMIGKNLMMTIKAYLSFCRSYSGFQKVDPKITWSLYLGTKEKKRWYDKVPSLRKPYNLMIILPNHVLAYINSNCEELLKYLFSQRHLGVDNFANTESKIEQTLRLTLDQLIQIKDTSDKSKIKEEETHIQNTLQANFQQWVTTARK